MNEVCLLTMKEVERVEWLFGQERKNFVRLAKRLSRLHRGARYDLILTSS